MAGSNVPPETPLIRASIRQTPSASYGSSEALAQAFGRVILEPAWWPADAAEISYSLDGDATRTHYRIASRRNDGSPIFLTGFPEVDWAGRSPKEWLEGEWSEPLELAHLRGLIGWVGTPPALHAVVYDEHLAIQLIGYSTEAEVMNALASLRRVAPN